jgi:hypothetical protein
MKIEIGHTEKLFYIDPVALICFDPSNSAAIQPAVAGGRSHSSR